MEILSRLPFDLQEHILVKVMKRYKLRDGNYVRQIDKTKYVFLDYIMRPSIKKHLSNSFRSEDLFYYKFYIKNLCDDPLRKESKIEDDIVSLHIEYKNNICYYEIGIYRLKLINIEENNFTPEKRQKDIYHRGSAHFWDFLEFSYEVK